mgnify:CR=1 FL=1
MNKLRLVVLMLFIVSFKTIYSQNDTILFENFTFGGSTLWDGYQYYGNAWDNVIDPLNDWGSGVIWQGPFNVQQPFNNLGWVNVSYGLPGVFGGLAGNQGFYGDVMFASPKYLYGDIFNIDIPQTLNESNNHYVRTILIGPSFDPSQYDIVSLEFASGHFPGASVNSFSDTCIIAISDGFETQVIDSYINETVSGVQTYDITEYINPESNNHQLLFQYSGVHPSGSGWAIDEIIVTGTQIGSTWDCNDNFACIEQSDGSGNFQSFEECEANCNATSIIENNLEVNIFPNPSSNIFNLEFNSNFETIITVTNILGEQVYIESTKSIGEFKTQIDLSNYSKGIYNLTIKTSDGVSNHKLILQ